MPEKRPDAPSDPLERADVMRNFEDFWSRTNNENWLLWRGITVADVKQVAREAYWMAADAAIRSAVRQLGDLERAWSKNDYRHAATSISIIRRQLEAEARESMGAEKASRSSQTTRPEPETVPAPEPMYQGGVDLIEPSQTDPAAVLRSVLRQLEEKRDRGIMFVEIEPLLAEIRQAQ